MENSANYFTSIMQFTKPEILKKIIEESPDPKLRETAEALLEMNEVDRLREAVDLTVSTPEVFKQRMMQTVATLRLCAMKRMTITYMELSEVLEHVRPGLVMKQVLDGVFELCQEEQNGWPNLTALVVGKNSGIPGEGWFTKCEEYGLIPDKYTSQEGLTDFWHHQKMKVFDELEPLF